MLCRANKLRAEVQLPSMQADDSWLRYFENAFDKAAKVRHVFVYPHSIFKFSRAPAHYNKIQASDITAQVDQINEELIVNIKP